MNNKNVYYDSATNQFFIGPELKKIETKMNEKLTEELESKGHISLHELYDVIAESITDEEVRRKFLEACSNPWVDLYGFADKTQLDLSDYPIRWDML